MPSGSPDNGIWREGIFVVRLFVLGFLPSAFASNLLWIFNGIPNMLLFADCKTWKGKLLFFQKNDVFYKLKVELFLNQERHLQFNLWTPMYLQQVIGGADEWTQELKTAGKALRVGAASSSVEDIMLLLN